jgi:hypothetical protein
MKKVCLLSCLFFLNIFLNAQENVGHFYDKKYEGQVNALEQKYINHAKRSYEGSG